MDFAGMTALELGHRFESGDADPRAVTDDFLARAAAADPAHRIYVRLLEHRARAEADAAAARAKSGLRRHALDGVPLSWKDLFDIMRRSDGGGLAAAEEPHARTRCRSSGARDPRRAPSVSARRR